MCGETGGGRCGRGKGKKYGEKKREEERKCKEATVK